MATLHIVGGEEGEQTIELGDGVVQIGRARDNDIVLTGAEKGVSRAHAELRFENGRYVIVDLQSQNGTWLNGRRVERATVPVGAEIALGEYRLTIRGDVPGGRSIPPRPGPARDQAVAPPRQSIDDLRLRDQPAPAATLPVIHAARTPSGTPAWMLTAVIAGVVVLGGTAAVWMSRTSAPATAAGPSRSAQPAPAVTPSAQPPGDQAPPERPNGATDAADPVVSTKRPSGPSGATGGARVARKPGESLETWRSRSAALQTRYGYSRAAMERGDFAAAAGGFEAILLEEPGFLDAAQLLVQAQSGLRTNARTLHQAGARLEASGDWVGALQKYEQARQIFSGIPGLADDVHRMREKLRIAGTNAFNQARQHDAAGRIEDALREYEKAVQWLPSDDPNRQIARTRVEQLKRD